MPFAVPNIETDLQCHHIHAPAGNRCGSPAMRGEYYCYHHHLKHAKRAQRRVLIDPEITRMELPVLEDRASIFISLAAVIHRLAENTIDTTRSGQMIYGLQAMLRALPPEPGAPRQTASPSDVEIRTTAATRHPQRSADAGSREVEGPAAGTSPSLNEAAPVPPKTINITKDSLVYFLRSRHCYNCNAELFPPEQLTERAHPGANPEIIEEARPALTPNVVPSLQAVAASPVRAKAGRRNYRRQGRLTARLHARRRLQHHKSCLAIHTASPRFALHSPRRSVSLRLARMSPGILVSSG